MEKLLEPKHGKWLEGEDELLRFAIKAFGEKHWNLISANVPGRSPIQCLHRWTKILKPGLVKGSWKDEEDWTLKNWVVLNGPQKWSSCCKLIPGRSGKQCRERWFNNLDPNIVKGQWTPIEDSKIFDLYQKEGPKWSLIAQAIPGRTENSIKNRFYSSLRKFKGSEEKKVMVKEENLEEKEMNNCAMVLEKLIDDYARSENGKLGLSENHKIQNMCEVLENRTFDVCIKS